MQQRILETYINRTDYVKACDRIQALAQSRQSSYIVAANVHVVMLAYWQSDYKYILDRAALVTPDGMPLVWGIQLLGFTKQSRVYGPDLMLAWCERAARNGLPIYLYGGTANTLESLSKKLQNKFPALQIAGMHSPPFRPLTLKEEAADADRINRSKAAVVLVGLGCPKQEQWMYRQFGQIDAVMIGVGAAFRFCSGEVDQAPRWIMKMGLEWAFRLIKEPRRLWQRYVLTNPAFVVLFLLQLIEQYLSSLLKFATRPLTRI